MMGPRQIDQAALFYEFSLERHVPATNLLRSIDRFVDLRAYAGKYKLSPGQHAADMPKSARITHVGSGMCSSSRTTEIVMRDSSGRKRGLRRRLRNELKMLFKSPNASLREDATLIPVVAMSKTGCASLGDFQQLRGLLVNIRKVVEHMKYFFKLPEIVIRS